MPTSTSNDQYGSYYKRSQSSKKQTIGKHTLEYLVKNDKGNFIHQQENVAQRQRHGLFSQPMSLATGDQYFDKQQEQVPKNVSINKRLVQKVGPELFEKMSSTNINDIYKDKFREQQLYLKQKTQLSIHATAFQAGGKQRLVKNSEFEHQKQFDDKVYNTKDEQGNVKVGLKNPTTNNMKKGFGNSTVGHLFGSYKYEGSPYDNAKEQESKERMIHKAKIHKPFAGSSKPSETFTPHYETFHLEKEPYQAANDEHLYRSKTNAKWTVNNANKQGLYGTFTQFPQYIEQGEKPKPPIHHENVWKQNFNGTSKGLGETSTKPCPVASQMVLNDLRRNKQ